MTQRGRGKCGCNSPVPEGKTAGPAKRVAGIKKKVDSGKYRVEPKEVADKMVEDAIREVRSRRR